MDNKVEKNPLPQKSLWERICSIPHLYGKIIVLWCIGFGTAASIYALRIISHTGHDSANVLAVILGFFGGELMVMCLNTIFKAKKADNRDSSWEE